MRNTGKSFISWIWSNIGKIGGIIAVAVVVGGVPVGWAQKADARDVDAKIAAVKAECKQENDEKSKEIISYFKEMRDDVKEIKEESKEMKGSMKVVLTILKK